MSMVPPQRVRHEVLDPRIRDVEAVVFDTDGVITDSARPHAAAWKEAFDACLREHPIADGVPRRPFDNEDYRRRVDGRSRREGAAAFLESRGLHLRDEDVDDPPGTATVSAVAARKELLFPARLGEGAVTAWPGTVRMLQALSDAGVPCGAADSASWSGSTAPTGRPARRTCASTAPTSSSPTSASCSFRSGTSRGEAPDEQAHPVVNRTSEQIMTIVRRIVRFCETGRDDVALVGGKNASLAEMVVHLAAAGVRTAVPAVALPPALEQGISEAYARLGRDTGRTDPDVAVRSSATAEDLPEASFAGQQESR
ncbi:hypothetical protein ABH925_002063 [Streptacidiphilus sp. EB129]